MTAFLWSFEKLARLCDHKDPEVKCWAADRIRHLYAKEAGSLMIRLLSDRNGSVAAQAAAYFCDDPDRNFADALLPAFRKSSGIVAKRLGYALALMKDGRLLDAVREKHALMPGDGPADFVGVLMNVALLGTDESQRYVEDSLRHLDSFGDFKEMAAGAFFNANIEAGTDIGKLLLFAYHSGVSGYVPALLAGIANRAGAWLPDDALAGKSGKGQASKVLASEVEASLALLARTGCDAGNAIEKLLKKRKFDEILEEAERTALAIRQAKRLERGEEAYLRWQARRDVPFFHGAALTALKATAAEVPAAQRETVAGIAIVVLALLAESRSLIALNPETLDADAALDLFFEERPDAPRDDAIMDLLAKRADVKNLVREAVRRVHQFPFSQMNGRLIRFAGRFIDEGLARDMLAMDFDGSGFEDDVAEAVGGLGPLSIPLLRPFFEKNDPAGIPLALRVLENLPTEEAVDLILSHWSLLWGGYREWLLDAVDRIGDKRFIPALKIELREGEQAEGEVFRLLCLINGATDPELERIKREMELREEREKRLQGAMEKEDIGAFLREPLEIPLKCRSCRNVYHYTVGKVFVAANGKDTVIEDHIVCKKCGALDHYEVANAGMIAVTARLALLTLDRETGKMDRDEMTVVPIRTVSAFGKEIPLQDLVDQYQKKLRKNPESPELLIGFANALRQIKRREDSVPFYERAIRIDPLAVEGYVSLGEYALEKGDPETAFSHYGKAAEIMDRGHYYRVTADLDQFKESLLDMLMMVSGRLGKGLTHPGDPRPVREAPLPARPAVGRNHPCPCGSGKKYKKCCLLKESGQGAAPAGPETRKPPTPDPVFRRLREGLARYAEREISREDFLRATGIFWNTETREPIVLPERASSDKGQFHDWLINDYRTANGKTILEGFCDRRLSTLSADERRLAESLMKSYLSVYEVQAVREGEGLTIRDLFTGETMDVEEVSGSYEAVKWDFVQVRVYRMDGKCRFGGNGQTMPRKRFDALKAYLDNARRSFEADTGRAGWPAFLKENAFLIGRFFDEVVEEPPVLLTEERHRIITSKAHFAVSDCGRARKLLSGEYDFADEEEIPSGGVSFSWLKRGPSKEWEMGAESDEKGMIATSSIVHPSGKMTFTVLGTVNLHPDRLILECMSRERLERGKERLLDLLGESVRHRIDEFEDIHVAMERREGKGEAAKPLKNEQARAMLVSVMQKYMSAWPDQEIPALGGKTPREAAATKAGREKVIDLIKDMENGEARKKKAGEPFIDLGPLRRELGIGRDEG
ncbi:MAG: SEC-C domain-containing protein [Proteobacteria bacterium]|nr:SEC-C domain-containing protein [Pseudomonadota bacterium]